MLFAQTQHIGYKETLVQKLSNQENQKRSHRPEPSAQQKVHPFAGKKL
jgi:hypothetical protein